MQTSYEKWNKFDVEGEEEQVDIKGKFEDRAKSIKVLNDNQTTVEREILEKNKDDEESLLSKSAVEELRRRRKGRRRRGENDTTHNSSPPPPTTAPAKTVPAPSSAPALAPTSAPTPETREVAPSPTNHTSTTPASKPISKTMSKAQAASDRASFLQSAYTCRSKGKELAKENDFEGALLQFQEGEMFVDRFEKSMNEEEDELNDSDSGENKDENDDPNATAKNKKSNSRNSRDLCCGPDAEYIKQQQKLLKPDPLRPRSDDPRSLITVLRRDFNLNIGRAHLSLSNLPAACDSLRYVLLVDGGNVNAWMARGEAFRRMGVSMLAHLHLIKATEIDEIDLDAKELKKRCEEEMEAQRRQKDLGDVDDGGSSNIVDSIISTNRSAKDLILDAIVLHKQANVLFREQFFSSAAEKYSSSAFSIHAAEKILNTVLPDKLNDIRVSSHLGCAACHMVRKRFFNIAEAHCSMALKVGEGNNVAALLRRSECR